MGAYNSVNFLDVTFVGRFLSEKTVKIMIKTESVYTGQRFVAIQKQKCNTTGKN